MDGVTLKDLFSIRSDRPDLVKAQLGAMSQQIPWLYFILCFNAIALAYTHYGDAPWYLTLAFPAVLMTFCVARLVIWYRARNIDYDHEAGVKKLKQLWILSAIIAIVFASWALLLYEHGNAFQQGHVAFFLSVTVVGCVFAVVQFPPAALTVLGIVSAMFFGHFVFAGNNVFVAMAVNFMLVSVVIYQIIQGYYGAFAGLIRSRRVLASQNRETQRLNQELAFHRDHLTHEVKKRTHELEQQTIKLEQALAAERELNQLQTEFVSMVSHEFRTPLAIIDANARRVDKHIDRMEPQEITQRMDKVRGSVTRLAGLVERALDASRLASGKITLTPGPYSLKALIVDVVERQKDISPGFLFKTDIEGLPGLIEGDVRLMDSVVANLLSNAVKYSGDSHSIIITGKELADDTVRVTVRDHGIGIPADELPKIATRFFRASTSTGIQGTGIGLNLVKSLVEQHGGRMSIDSSEGNWTEVSFTVPVSPNFTSTEAAALSAIA